MAQQPRLGHEPDKEACLVQSLARKILLYLIDHPDAEDSLEGIVGWWLLEQEIRTQENRVREAVRMLKDRNLIIESSGRGAEVRYRANWDRKEKIMVLLDDSFGERNMQG
ncbi:MAG: hypothetical protein A4E57_00937 [Syntrophorhabdaceae bacterium PtaU1.Bin034]|jgi:hypothetical protein|nr:MAG: hypothetical protein A4E57_00937 [Syntrophorhabdaceae bacterium PtaU1.Bin034]